MKNEAAVGGNRLPTSAGPTTKLHALQALRAIAALLVVFDHAVLNMVVLGAFPEALRQVAFQAGSFGVSLFFAISGFIMGLTSRNDHGAEGAKRFILRRIWRVAPLYWLWTLAYAGKQAMVGATPNFGELIRSLLFIPYFDHALVYHPVLGPGWTLNFEMYFYLVFALAMLAPRRFALPAMCGTFLAGIAIGYAVGWQDGRHGAVLKFLTDPILGYFVVGVAVYGLTRRWSPPPLAPARFAAGVALALALLLARALLGLAPETFTALSLVLAPALLVLAVASPSWRGLGPLAAGAILLGDASYSLYLSHSFAVGGAARVFALAAHAPMPVAIGFIVLTLVGCAAFGIACYRWIETPLLGVLRPVFVGAKAQRGRSARSGAPA